MPARLALIAIGICGVAGLFVAIEVLELSDPQWWLYSAGFCAMVVFSFVAYARITIKAHVGYTPKFSPLRGQDAVDPEDIDRFIAADGESRISDHQVLTFVGCVLAPREYFVRITEHVESYHRSTMVRTVFTLRLYLPSGGDSAIADDEATGNANRASGLQGYIIPLYLPAKGQITDGLRVFDISGSRVSTVDARTQHAFTAASIRFLIRYASHTAYTSYLANDRAIERQVIKAVLGPTLDRPSIAEVRSLVASLDAEPSDVLNLVSDFVEQLALFRPIAVSVSHESVAAAPWPATHRYALERRFVADFEAAPTVPFTERARNKLDGLRLALGVRLNRVYFPLDAAYRTDSYHLEVEGPQGTYFAKGAIFEPRPPLVVDYTARDQDRRGQRRSHTYIRGMSGGSGAHYGAQFFERAPGSLSSAFVSSLVSSVLIVALGFMILTPLQKGAPDNTSNVVTALLALPIAASAFLGLDSAQGKRHPSLLSRGIALFTTLVSLAAFVIALIREPFPVGALWWHLVVLASLITTTIAFTSWCIRLATETRFVRGHAVRRVSDRPGGKKDG